MEALRRVRVRVRVRDGWVDDDGWMDGRWIDGWMNDGWLDGWVDEWMDG